MFDQNPIGRKNYPRRFATKDTLRQLQRKGGWCRSRRLAVQRSTACPGVACVQTHSVHKWRGDWEPWKAGWWWLWILIWVFPLPGCPKKLTCSNPVDSGCFESLSSFQPSLLKSALLKWFFFFQITTKSHPLLSQVYSQTIYYTIQSQIVCVLRYCEGNLQVSAFTPKSIFRESLYHVPYIVSPVVVMKKMWHFSTLDFHEMWGKLRGF